MDKIGNKRQNKHCELASFSIFGTVFIKRLALDTDDSIYMSFGLMSSEQLCK